MSTQEQLLERTRRWRKTKRGLVTNLYHNMKGRHPVKFDLEWLHSFADCQKFNRLYDEWVTSKYSKQRKPSIDRINRKKGYLKDNVQWMTWAENRYKQVMERRCRKGPVAQTMDGEVVRVYSSQREAVMQTGLSQGNMSAVLNGKRNLCGGYQWVYIYENPELLEGKK